MPILASDGTPGDVQTKLLAAGPGDTVTLPAGTFNWTTGVSATILPGVKLIGAGTEATGGADITIIQDNIASGSQLLLLNVADSSVSRISGITFRSGTGALKDSGTIQINGPGFIRIDHCHFISTSASNYKQIWFGTGIFGVMDRCVLDFQGTNALYFYNGRDNGTGGGRGNYEWTLPTEFGSENFFFIEDCIVNGDTDGSTYSTRLLDGFTAARVVVRFNDLYQTCVLEQHAVGHSFDDRGPRAMEAYGNRVTSSLVKNPNFTAVDLESGTALIWNNLWGNVFKNIYRFDVKRKDNGTYTQSATPAGWGYAGTFFNGIGSNWDYGTFHGTDLIYGTPAIDQPGRGAGDLLIGEFPDKVNSTTGTIRTPNQALEPIYLWNNDGAIVSGWGGAVYSNAAYPRVVENRDYYPPAGGIQVSPAAPFNGTVGVGWGNLANRPVTCTPGVAYFVMDEGSWNESDSNPYGTQMNGASGRLYKCTAPNVWTLYYTPYTYPHPLREFVPEEPGQHPPPVITPPAGSYTVPQNVTISIS